MNPVTIGNVTETIYKAVFGKTQAQLIAESKGHWTPESIAMHNADVHEIMCDLMTTEALAALNTAHVISANHLLNTTTFDAAWLRRLEEKLANCRLHSALWEWESER